MLPEAPQPYFNQDNGIPSGVPSFDEQQNPEAAILVEAIREVALMYAGDRVASLTGTPTEERDQAWEETAQEFPQFGEQIRKLRLALLEAEKTRSEYYRSINPLFALRIGNYEDEMAGRFLTDILLSRITTASGNLINREEAIEERNSMYRELGYPEGQRKHPTDGFVTVQKAVGAILQGRLRVLSNDFIAQPPEPPAAQ